MKCEYCERPWNCVAQCQGCGAFQPSHPSLAPTILYDPQVFDVRAAKFFGIPGKTIPVNLKSDGEPCGYTWFEMGGI